MSGLSQSTGYDPARLVRDHQVGVWRFLRAIGCDPELSADLTQETFLAVFQRPFQDYNATATAAYLRRVARNLYITHQRRNRRPIELLRLEEIEDDWSKWAGDDDGEAAIAQLRVCLDELTPRAQLALRMRYTEQKPRLDIARALSLSEHGAKNLMQRAKAVLRKCVERRLRT
jgi:RNA polymerase sigma-70 factor (ECF subfamily)